MESFRTIVHAGKAPFVISHSDRILLLGSCFTEHIGEKLRVNKFPVCINPSGIVYNPVSIARMLSRLVVGDQPFEPADLFEHDGLWHSWEHHGRFSGPDPEQVLLRINTAYREAADFLRDCSCLVLTLGSAIVYGRQDGQQIVANCHKVPARQFVRQRLSTAKLLAALLPAIQAVRALRPEIRIILSVSPVRHGRDGAVENNRSKAALLLACAELEQQVPGAWYFPAYELLMDDLRDYRFYTPDMLHPSQVAVDYIWEQFAGSCFSQQTTSLNQQIQRIVTAVGHRPLHPGTTAHDDFLRRQKTAIEALLQQHPTLDFEAERAALENQGLS